MSRSDDNHRSPYPNCYLSPAHWYAFSLSIVAVVSSPPALGACPIDWTPGRGFPGVQGTVYAMTNWDPDGPGPEPEVVIVGGEISVAGGAMTDMTAVWDGMKWRSFGEGWFGYTNRLKVCGNRLMAAGDFTDAEGGRHGFVEWSGTNWQPIGNALGYGMSVVEFEGRILAGGYAVTGDLTTPVAELVNGQWQPFGPPMAPNSYVIDFFIRGEELIIIGEFAAGSARNIARWSGSDWEPLSDFEGDPLGTYLCIAEFDGDLFCGGAFPPTGGNSSPGIVRWDGNLWHVMAEGLYPFCEVYAMNVRNGRLEIAGSVDLDVEFPSNHVLAWDGHNWSRLQGALNGYVFALTSLNGKCMAGGPFDATTLARLWGVAVHEETEWIPASDGLNGDVSEMLEYNGELIMGGNFSHAGTRRVNGIVRWTGDEFAPMETGLWNECLSGITTNGCFIPSVSGIVEFQGDLIVSGSFDRAGDVSVSRVARWDGEGWAAMGEMGPGVATAFLEFDGKLFAGGNFPTGVGSERYGVRVWNNGAWDPVDVGFTCRRPFVSALSVFDGKLIAGGSDLFTATTSNQCVAELTVDGWMPIGTGIQGNPVRALAVYDGKLVAAGQVFISGESGPTPGVIEWDGISWRRLGGGVTHQFFTQVNSLALFDGNLVVAGSFSGAGGVSVQNIAIWNGSSWLPMSHGLNRLTSAMTTFRGGLACGSGFFDSLSGRVSHGFSLWESQGPRFTSEPTSSWVCPSGTAAFSGTAEATGSAIYQWLRNGVELKDGGNISGATGPKLTIAAADLADEGEYSLRVSDNCGTSSSEPALLTVPCCGARPNGDLNHDGSTNGADIQIFIDSVLSGVRLAGSVCIADFNHDRLLDVQDVIPFADAMMQGN